MRVSLSFLALLSRMLVLLSGAVKGGARVTVLAGGGGGAGWRVLEPCRTRTPRPLRPPPLHTPRTTGLTQALLGQRKGERTQQATAGSKLCHGGPLRSLPPVPRPGCARRRRV